ncbi:hypothetical protein B0A48_13818 [Cryoendolithus antarcticus]|uniref:Uncharacterized protein n=1 Tax=Cryoendolithus antarcticus TaxID=1507870 RepID=A0A1V8SMX5_9PEZI|nr:hypothetical protein B0A48_13818 [Cryoendolithus antarcticus]
MPARYECLCADTVPYGLAAIREDKIRKCMREGCLQWQHVACSSDLAIQTKARELVRCNGCCTPPTVAPVMQKEPTSERASKFVNIDDKKLSAAEARAKALRETKALMARQKEDRRLREVAEQERIKAEQQAKLAAEQTRVAKVKAEAEAAAAARAAKIAEEKAAEKHADELRKKRKREEGARYEEQQAVKRKQELIKQQEEEKKRAEIERLAQLKREIEERKVAQKFEAKVAKEAKETDEAKLKRKREKYQAQLAGLKEKIERTEGAKPEVHRAVMASASASESGAQILKADAQDEADQQPGRRLAAPTSKGHAFSGQSKWSRPSGSGQQSVGTGLQPRTPFGNAYSHKPGRQSFSISDFTSTQSQPRVTGSMREHPSPSGQPAHVKLLDQLKTSATPASTSTPTSTRSEPPNQPQSPPQLDGTFDTNETMSTNDRVAKWCADNSMRAAKAYKGTRKVNPDDAIEGQISADHQEFPIEIDESESESSDEEMIELPVLHPEIKYSLSSPVQTAPVPPTVASASVEGIWSHNYNTNVRTPAPSTATITPPESNAELGRVIFRFCSTYLWASYCDLPEGPEESKKVTQFTKLDDAPEEWLDPIRISILLLLQAEKETGREGLLDVLANGSRVDIIKALSAECMFQCYRGVFKGRKRTQIGILLEVVGMAMRGCYWDP